MHELRGGRDTYKLHAGAVRFSREGSDSCRELLDARLYQIDLAIEC
ncbi:hypothetical protein A8926_0166 [Saccharopolyspora spinosa]|uniref:Uncharacterized protein n=1 Tax=Saccharopolyspora spinosa TaxID=60894 RepID=A0A2N3XQ26_SACSN|nr:hypothetical protein A8926_0166 [Saccharopolyspora spinosa]